jgi:hypothetical protein
MSERRRSPELNTLNPFNEGDGSSKGTPLTGEGLMDLAMNAIATNKVMKRINQIK